MTGTATASLTDFLLARIAEDETVATAAVGSAVFDRQTGDWSFEHAGGEARPIVFALTEHRSKTQVANLSTAWDREARGQHIAHWHPARVLAECEAKRDIVREHVGYGGICGTCGVRKPETGEPWPCRTLRLLALPYADHPDYREEWRP